jgi:hypothetical protein
MYHNDTCVILINKLKAIRAQLDRLYYIDSIQLKIIFPQYFPSSLKCLAHGIKLAALIDKSFFVSFDERRDM